MPGGVQRRSLAIALRKGIIPTPTGRFRRVSDTASKIECVECGQTGWGDVEPDVMTAAPWQLAHMMPHLYPCSCGQRFTAPWHLATHLEPARYIPAHRTRGEHHWAAPSE